MARSHALLFAALLAAAGLIVTYCNLLLQFRPAPVAASFAPIPSPAPLSAEPQSRPHAPSHAHLHLLIVATSTNIHLCRLFLSASVLDYPPPVLIDWAGEGEYDASASHLAKIAGPLRYLDALPPSRDGDLILLVDGMDLFLQLGPEVLIRRYFAATAAANARIVEQFGANHTREHALYDNILFGPDKMCWPLNMRRTACWAVPESTLSKYAFGPTTDADMVHARPRWLNSGTVMGPAAEMRTFFRATWDRVNRTYDESYHLRNSDQMYFADVWGDQEYARMIARHGHSTIPMPKMTPDDKIIPDLDADRETDFHIALDYESRLFQTAAGYRKFITWMNFSGSSISTPQSTTEPWKMDLDEDVLRSRKPFASITDDEGLQSMSWRNVSLGVNTITGLPFPILHFTGDKSLRDLWWPRMWFFPQAERLLRVSGKDREDTIGTVPIEGTTWLKHHAYVNDRSRNASALQLGAWSDQGQRLSWDELCKKDEPVLFGHAEPKAQ